MYFSVQCPVLCPPDNGGVYMTSTNVGGQASYNCNKHYQLIGQDNMTCETTGNWSKEDPYCAATGNMTLILFYSLYF